jgi:hypothetical protein
MNIKKYLPLNKEDLSFVKELNKVKDIEKIREDIPMLLEWLQDFNWEQADLMCSFLLQFPLVSYKNEITEILSKDDDMWKYWILLRLVKPNINKSDDWIIPIIEKLAFDPTLLEQESEVDEIAQEILDTISV